MKKRTRGVLIGIIILSLLVFAVGGLFCYTLLGNPAGAQLTDFFQYSLVPSETVYIMLGLGVVLLLALIWLLDCAVSTASAMQKVRRAWAKYENKNPRRSRLRPDLPCSIRSMMSMVG